MARAIWSGSIAFGLVNAPVRLYSAIDEHRIEFHLVHRKDGSRIGYQKVCKEEGKEVPDDEVVKGYETNGHVVLVDDVQHVHGLPFLALGRVDGRQDEVVLVAVRRDRRVASPGARNAADAGREQWKGPYEGR